MRQAFDKGFFLGGALASAMTVTMPERSQSPRAVNATPATTHAAIPHTSLSAVQYSSASGLSATGVRSRATRGV